MKIDISKISLGATTCRGSPLNSRPNMTSEASRLWFGDGTKPTPDHLVVDLNHRDGDLIPARTASNKLRTTKRPVNSARCVAIERRNVPTVPTKYEKSVPTSGVATNSSRCLQAKSSYAVWNFGRGRGTNYAHLCPPRGQKAQFRSLDDGKLLFCLE